MANQQGQDRPPEFRRGDKLRAEDLNKISRQSIERVVGADGIQVGAVGSSITVRGDKTHRHPAPTTIIVEIVEESEETPGEYTWTLLHGSGPDEGTAIELDELSGVEAGTRVVLQRAGGIWYFKMAGGASLTWWRVDDVLEDVLLCTKLDEDDLPTDDTGHICKPRDLKRSSWDGLTLDGWTYERTGDQTRFAENGGEEEFQIIIPKYLPGISIILVAPTTNGYGPIFDVGIEPVGLDTNNTHRSWAEDFDDV